MIDGRQTLVRFDLAERRLTVVTDRIGRAWWRRDYPDGTVDEGFIGPTSPECIPRLFDWLLDETVSRRVPGAASKPRGQTHLLMHGTLVGLDGSTAELQDIRGSSRLTETANRLKIRTTSLSSGDGTLAMTAPCTNTS